MKTNFALTIPQLVALSAFDPARRPRPAQEELHRALDLLRDEIGPAATAFLSKLQPVQAEITKEPA